MRSKLSQIRSKITDATKIENDYVRCFLAEFLGTLILITFLLSSIAQYKFYVSGNILLINLSDGYGLAMCILVVGKVSGNIFIFY